MNSYKIAFVYDRINKFGGAEQVLSQLHQMWPDAPIYTSVYSRKDTPWADNIRVVSSFLQSIPFATTRHEWLFSLMPYAFESFDFSEYDIVISVSSAQAKGIVTRPGTLHINYLLTPTKYLYTQRDIHLKENPFGKLGEKVLNYLWEKEVRWDTIAAQRADLTVAISEVVAKRSVRFYKRKVDKVIYPPVNIHQFEKAFPAPEHTNYYLLVSRLVPSKRVDVAIKAFNKLGKKLIIIGAGSEEKKLKKMSKSNIIFTGQIPTSQLVGYYQNCESFIYPAEEDFGIVMVEALAAGKPVIAYKKGAASEIVVHGQNGLLFDHQTPSSIMKVIQNNTKIKFSAAALKKSAQKFDSNVFKTQFGKYVEESWKTHKTRILE